MTVPMDLTDADILIRLTDLEDSFTERKTVSDLGDVLKTAVAFANSTPVDYPALLFVGVRNNGEVEGISNPEKVQNSVSDKIAAAYPTIYHATRVLTHDSKTFLTVVIPGSPARPHFAGASYVRDDNKSVIASREQFDRLIAERNSKTYEILKWRGRIVTKLIPTTSIHGSTYTSPVVVVDCNQFYVTLANASAPSERQSIPLRLVELGYDDASNRVALHCHGSY